MSDPQIPAALAPVVVGVHALHDFMPHPMHRDLGAVKRRRRDRHVEMRAPASPSTTARAAPTTPSRPADFATIYNLNPLFTAGYRGAGQTIVGHRGHEHQERLRRRRRSARRSASRATRARSRRCSPTGKTTCKSPGVNAAEGEAALDAEWAGSSAPDAAIELASCADTSDGVRRAHRRPEPDQRREPAEDHEHQLRRVRVRERRRANASYVSTYEQAAARGRLGLRLRRGRRGGELRRGRGLRDARHLRERVRLHAVQRRRRRHRLHGRTTTRRTAGPRSPRTGTRRNGTTYSSALSYIPEIPWNDSCASKLIYSARQGTRRRTARRASARAPRARPTT